MPGILTRTVSICVLNTAISKVDDANVEEDGFYALAAYRFGKFLPVVRYDMYRDKTNKTSANNRDAYLVGCTYELIKNLKFQVNYIHHYLYR